MKKFKKNWKKICQIEDFHFRMAVSLVDVSTEFGQEIAEDRFREYFNLTEDYVDEFLAKEDIYPVPLSVLLALARAEAVLEKSGEADTEMLVCYSGYWEKMDIQIPEICFATEDNCVFEDVPMLPMEIRRQIKRKRKVKIGNTFTWEGKKIVLMENGDNPRNGYFLFFAPAECVDVSK